MLPFVLQLGAYNRSNSGEEFQILENVLTLSFNLGTYDLLSTLKTTPPTPFAEQDFLNMFFRGIYESIPQIYNLVLTMLWRHYENIELEKVKVVHYCAAGSKPWRYTGKEENMDQETSRCCSRNGGTFTMMSPWIARTS
ncbi:OLC1v1006330C1 [Oldenlandia corymbosa var. corymbosa]|uniref:Hexosyltransferase n=1 Tax=Oldenlandia corymbosa var. corymbosa TaxID=529605 RepID=A0AAV1DJ39_OLDCO|nr:OLC1v1006330C1 [Oldenlandia corymbosa var. corymbosa]